MRGSPALYLVGAALTVIALILAVVLFSEDDGSEPPSVDAYPPASTGMEIPSTTTTFQSYATTTTPPLTGPAAVVQDYFDAITRRDYVTAWNLGGRNFEPNFNQFVADLATTAKDTVTIIAVVGNQVHITLDALQTDGSHRYFAGYYIVEGGVLVSARIHVA
ncbi:hypothetical protein HLB23_37215 [Nocardia uniformis]|uniref:Uncharacterized protein n=1 Tax=Nocardia uniformis TaxID=53432 RepID=A0A849CFS9_9NOCA|nr:hypothetical protein [Nocardia uniformis]NNH75427.1 hypothetical protein [Nocardia uniformis]